MTAFIILIASVVAGVLLSRFFAKHGLGKLTRRALATVFGAMMFLAALGVYLGNSGTPATGAHASAPEKPELTDRSTYAYAICKNAVRDRLRSPSTADFPWGPDMSRMIPNDDKQYVIIGHVDAQNGFGATIRADWNCEATYKGEGFGVADDRGWTTKVVMQSR